MDDEITLNDVLEYLNIFTHVPSFLLKNMARRNSNLVVKFKPTVQSHLESLNDDQRKKLDIILNSDIDDLQVLMREAFLKTNKKQFKILADPKNKNFIKLNLDEIKKLV